MPLISKVPCPLHFGIKPPGSSSVISKAIQCKRRQVLPPSLGISSLRYSHLTPFGSQRRCSRGCHQACCCGRLSIVSCRSDTPNNLVDHRRDSRDLRQTKRAKTGGLTNSRVD